MTTIRTRINRDRLVAFFAEVMTDEEAREAADIASGKEFQNR
jgi:hypothetical protein